MKKIVSVLMLVFALILGGCGAGADLVNDDYKFDSINKQIATLNQQIADLQQKVNDLPGGPAGPPGPAGDNGATGPAGPPGISPEEIAAINEQITILKTEVTDLTNELNALKTQVATDNVTIDQRLTALESNCSSVLLSITELGQRVSDLEDAIDALTQDPEPRTNSFLFAGVGDPEEIAGAQVNDFYIDLDPRCNGNYKMWFLTSDGWVYFGQIFKPTGGDRESKPSRAVIVK